MVVHAKKTRIVHKVNYVVMETVLSKIVPVKKTRIVQKVKYVVMEIVFLQFL